MAGVAVGPGDIHSRAALYVDFYVLRLLSLVNRCRHDFRMTAWASDLTLAARFRWNLAAIARRNRIAMRARGWMPQERADFFIQFRADDVLELASLVVHFLVFDSKRILEEALRQAVPPHHIPRALRARLRQPHVAVLHLD